MNFSINIVSSPNAFLASFLASWYAFSKSSSFRTTRIPRPPPPAAAFTITGKVIRLASDNAKSYTLKSPFES